MSYRVLLDGVDILSYEDNTLALIEPKLNMEVNTVDSFEFKMPPTHQHYALPQVLTSTVEILEDDIVIWFGRVISIDVDFYRQKDILCEGALGWLNDSVTEFREYSGISVETLFRNLFTNHNSQVAENRRIRVNRIRIEDVEVKERIGYERTLDVLENQCLDKVKGYMFFTKRDGYYFVDFLDYMPYSCNQPIEFGLNMIDMKASFDGSDFFTCLLPYGDTVAENDKTDYGDIVPPRDPRIGKPLTLNTFYGSNIIRSTYADIYGDIIKAVKFNGVRKAVDLYAKAQAYLAAELYDRHSFECSAIELKRRPDKPNENYDAFRIGQNVKCHSIPHALDIELPLLKMDIELDSATKQVIVGTAPHKDLTDRIVGKAVGIDPKTNTDYKNMYEGMIWQLQDEETGAISDTYDLVVRFVTGG